VPEHTKRLLDLGNRDVGARDLGASGIGGMMRCWKLHQRLTLSRLAIAVLGKERLAVSGMGRGSDDGVTHIGR